MVRRDKTNYVIQSVAHSLDVLEQFFRDVDELGVTELSKRLKLHKNNVFRLLATLEARGYIEQNKSTENYRLGIRCLHLGRSYINHMGLVRQARPILAEVARKCRESTFVGDRAARWCGAAGVGRTRGARGEDHAADRQSAAAALHRVRQGPSGVRARRGAEVDAARTAARATPPRTIAERAELIEQLHSVARDGYAVDSGEYMEDVSSVAVPIRDYTRTVVGSLAVAGPAYRIPGERISNEIAPLILEAGQELSLPSGLQRIATGCTSGRKCR